MGTSYSPNIVKDGLVFSIDAANPRSYPGSGTQWDNLQNTSTSGSLLNNPSFDSNNLGSIVLDGSDDRVDIESIVPSLNLSAGTMDIWFKPHDNTGWKYLISTGNRASNWNVNHYNVAYNHDDQKIGVFVYGSTTTSDDTIGGGVFTENGIHNFVVASDGKTYVNGIEEANTLGASWFNSPDTINFFNLGVIEFNNSIYGSQEYDGGIYSFKIYNRALSAQEVKQNYNALKRRFI